jgi:hypothetical protein
MTSVNGRNRDPRPPASMTAFMSAIQQIVLRPLLFDSAIKAHACVSYEV